MLQKTHDCPKIKYEINNKSLKCDKQQNHKHSVKQIKKKEKNQLTNHVKFVMFTLGRQNLIEKTLLDTLRS